MDAATLTILLSAISSPASAVVVALLFMFGFYHFLIKHILPSQEKHLDRIIEESSKNRNLFQKESSENRKIFQVAVDTMCKRIDKVEDSVEDIKIILKERS